MEIRQVEIKDIKVGEHAQRIDENDPETVELAASIKRIGVISPLLVAESGGDLILVAGHRRYAAAMMAGLAVVPCIVRKRDQCSESEISFAENFFRKNLSPVELACALKDCLEKTEMDVAEIAQGFHRTEHWVHQMVAIADWPDDVLRAVHSGAISVSAAANLVQITDNQYREFLVAQAESNGATARATAAWLQAYLTMAPAEEAVQATPVAPGAVQPPMVPQAPCLCCSQLFKVNEMSHVPVCGACIQLLRVVGAQGVAGIADGN